MTKQEQLRAEMIHTCRVTRVPRQAETAEAILTLVCLLIFCSKTSVLLEAVAASSLPSSDGKHSHVFKKIINVRTLSAQDSEYNNKIFSY